MRFCPSCGVVLPGVEWACTRCSWRATVIDGIAQLIPPAEPASARLHAPAPAVADPGHFWFVGRNELILWAIATHAPGARTFLEVGCGTGYVLRALESVRPDLSLTGTDPSDDALHVAAKLAPRTTLLRADARSLPFRDEFDVVGAFDVLEHIPQDAEALAGLASAARPGGVVVVTVPQHRWLWSAIDHSSGHQRRYTRRELLALARRAGLKTLRVTSFVSFLLPALMLSRFLQRRAVADPGREFRISTRINAPALTLMRWERALISRGISLPAGGSLLLVAVRP
jgi:SAM-dependent methyltransferase